MTGDSSYEAWTVFMLTRDPEQVCSERLTHMTDIERRMYMNQVNTR